MTRQQLFIPKKLQVYPDAGVNQIGNGERWFSEKIFDGDDTGDLRFTDPYDGKTYTAYGGDRMVYLITI